MKKQHNISLAISTNENTHYKDHGTPAFRTLFLLTVTAVFIFMGCMDFIFNGSDDDDESVLVEVSAFHDHDTGKHTFVTDREEVPSGWVTFRFTNETDYVHFMLLDLFPGDKTVEDSKNEVIPIFQEAMYLLMEGNINDGFAKLGELPAWSNEITYMGGPGLVSGGHTAETTVYLTPGNYAMECYIKTKDGTFHSAVGMLEGFVVTEETSEAPEPSDTDIQMTLTNQGFGVEGDLKLGKNNVAVLFNEDEPPFTGNDVHLAKLSDDTAIEDVTAWMDWSQPTGLVSDHDSPAPAEFIGGTHEMPKGNTAYFTVDLEEPGRYAWISERPAATPLYEEFMVQ